MNPVDRFISGKDALSAVLKTLPRFSPPEPLALQVLQAACSQEAERRATQKDALAACTFEPPARLRNTVLQEAQALEQTQAARQKTIMDAMPRRAGSKDTPGTAASPQTEAWLRKIWAPQAADRLASFRPGSARKPARWQGWALGAVFGTALVASLVAHQYWSVEPGALPEPAVEVADAKPASAVAPLPPAPVSPAAPVEMALADASALPDEKNRLTTLDSELKASEARLSELEKLNKDLSARITSRNQELVRIQSAPAPATPSGKPVPTAKPDAAAPAEKVFIQTGAFANAANAQAMVRDLKKRGYTARTARAGKTTQVRIGPLPRNKAERIAAKLKAQGRNAVLTTR
jgi:cell division septation protein DedD